MGSLRAARFFGILAACAVALASGSALAGLGDDFGARDPASCPFRDAPKTGAPSQQQMLRYLACDVEKIGDMGEYLYLIGEPLLEIAPKGRALDPKSDVLARDADPKLPVFDVRGYFRYYRCGRKTSIAWTTNPGHACRYQQYEDAKGLCWRDAHAEWHCMMDFTFDLKRTIHDAVPPTGGPAHPAS